MREKKKKKIRDIERNSSLLPMTMVTQPIDTPTDSITEAEAAKQPVIRVSTVVVDSSVVTTVIICVCGAVRVLVLFPVVGAVGAD